jgi:hypothetical protein
MQFIEQNIFCERFIVSVLYEQQENNLLSKIFVGKILTYINEVKKNSKYFNNISIFILLFHLFLFGWCMLENFHQKY